MAISGRTFCQSQSFHSSGSKISTKKLNNLVRTAIITQVGDPNLSLFFTNPQTYYSSLEGSFVDYVSIGGSVPVIIPYDMELDKMAGLLDQTDMLVLPGGSLANEQNGSYQRVVDFIVSWVVTRNGPAIVSSRGAYPLYVIGTSTSPFLTSFVNMKITSPLPKPIITCGASVSDVNKTHKIVLKPALNATKILSTLKYEWLQDCAADTNLFFNHTCALTLDTFEKSQDILGDWVLAGTSTLNNSNVSLTIVSLLEHSSLPIVISQFDPSKTIFSRGNTGVPLVDRGVSCTRFASDFIIKLVGTRRDWAKSYAKPEVQRWFSLYDANSQYMIAMYGVERQYTYKRFYSRYPQSAVSSRQSETQPVEQPN